MTGFFSGALVALFQLAGRSRGARFGSVGQAVEAIELRLVALIVLTLWLAWLVAVRGPYASPVGAAVRPWRNMIVVFVLYMVGTSVWAPDFDLAMAKSNDLMFVVWSCLLTVAALRLCGPSSVIEGFWTALFVIGAGLAAVATVVVILGDSSGQRLSVLGGGPNVFGRNMGLVTLSALHFIFGPKSWLRVPALGLAPVSALFVLQSGSRGAMLSLFVGLIVFLSLHRADRRILLSVLFLAIISVLVVTTRFGDLAAAMFRERFIVLLLIEGYFTHRDTLLLDGFRAGLEHPVGGLGLAGFVQLDSPGTYPHNIFVEAFAEGGTAGLLLLFVPFFWYVHRWWRGLGLGDSLTVAGLSLLLMSSSISGDLFDARGVFLLLIMAVASQDFSRTGIRHGR